MNKIRSLAFLGLLLLISSGCANYQSKFQIGTTSFTLPKDAAFSYLEINVPGSNGPLSLVLSNASFKMNPAVIDAVTAHDIAVFNAGKEAALQLLMAVPK
jgi:hypothetical protein